MELHFTPDILRASSHSYLTVPSAVPNIDTPVFSPPYNIAVNGWYEAHTAFLDPSGPSGSPASFHSPESSNLSDITSSPDYGSGYGSPYLMYPSSSGSGSDIDADGVADDSSSEYMPSPSLSPPAGPSSTPLPVSRARNLQTTLPRQDVRVTAYKSLTCPVCGYEQKNRRKPDLDRHIQSHYREAEPGRWQCLGLPVDEVTAMTMVNPWCFEGQWYAGGCRKTFSRSDALKRHIKNEKLPCCAAVDAPYNIGNRTTES